MGGCESQSRMCGCVLKPRCTDVYGVVSSFIYSITGDCSFTVELGEKKSVL